MPFHRSLALPEPVQFDALTARMVGIGMNFAATPEPDPNIEDTLVLASIEAMEKHDLRVLAVLVTWFGLHVAWVNADRLTHLAAAQDSPRVRALWSALAGWQQKDRRFGRLSKLYVGRRQDVIETGTDFQVSRHGEDVRFDGTPIRVAANILRDRTADVLQPSDLARTHRAYRYRVMMGPSYRADMWAALEGRRLWKKCAPQTGWDGAAALQESSRRRTQSKLRRSAQRRAGLPRGYAASRPKKGSLLPVPCPQCGKSVAGVHSCVLSYYDPHFSHGCGYTGTLRWNAPKS